jgi:Prokaryotic N-terminal methylation motif
MRRAQKNSGYGFSLIELLVAMAVGMIVITAAVKLCSQGMNATFVVSQRAEMQQDLRSATDLVTKDISLAGAGLPSGSGIALAAGTGTKSIYGFAPSCVAKNNCVPGNGIAYPCSALAGPCIPTLYGVIPGYRMGITPAGSPNPSDVITTTYTDSVFLLNCYQVTSITATSATFQLPAPLPASCVLPAGLLAPQAINNAVVGIKTGDVILFQGTVGGNTAYAVAEVTAPPTNNGGGNYTLAFANGDTLRLNQSTATSGDLAQLANPAPAATTTATRILITTYYLWNLPDPLTGVAPFTPVLMRQVNGQTPVPVAENVTYLQFTYDTYDTAGNLLNATGDGGYSLGISFNLVRKINIAHLTIRSQLAGAGSGFMLTKGYQTFDLQTSISARNLSYQNRYSLGP